MMSNCKQLIKEATIWGIQALVATNPTREAIASYWPDVVLLDLCFDNSADSGLELLAELRTSHLPSCVYG